MCLITSQTKPLVAKRDIVCTKLLIRACRPGTYKTPYREMPVKLHTLLEPKEDVDYTNSNYTFGNRHEIEGGFIHAYISNPITLFSNYVRVKAIIPKGSEYYINDAFGEVAARKMFITDELIATDDTPMNVSFSSNILEDVFDSINEIIDSNVVSPGWYRLADGNYIHPSSLTDINKNDIIGVVAYVHDDKIGVMSLDEWLETWSCKYDIIGSISTTSGFGDGEHNTDNVLKNTEYSPKDYPAFSLVNSYYTKNTKPGDWYLPDSREVHEMCVESNFKINTALCFLKRRLLYYRYIDKLKTNLYWTSTVFSSTNAVGVYMLDGTIEARVKKNAYCVRAFLRHGK